MKFICLILTLTTTISGRVHDFKWQLWKSQHAKSYLNDTEELLRRQIWDSNLEKVMGHNKRADEGKESYWLEMNQFADMTIEELVQENVPLSWDVQKSSVRIHGEVNEFIPRKMDWRKKECVTKVKNQKKCGSCWAFAAVGVIESRFCVKHNRLYSFSEQQLVDCDKSNNGCGSKHAGTEYSHSQIQTGLMKGNDIKYKAVLGKTESRLCAKYGQLYSFSEQQMAECEKLNKVSFRGSRVNALTYIQKEGGLMKEETYPYKAAEGHCQYNKTRAVKIDISQVKKIDADKIAYDVYKYGPTTFGINIMKDFHLYKKGIYSVSDCSQAKGRHAMIIVGYEPDSWTVKNSWGEKWGEKGYVHIKRGVNTCRMEEHVYSPYLK